MISLCQLGLAGRFPLAACQPQGLALRYTSRLASKELSADRFNLPSLLRATLPSLLFVMERLLLSSLSFGTVDI